MSVPRRVLLRVFLRSVLLQASWNRKGMQNLGFAWAMWPALEALYPEGEPRVRAARRHLAFFNCHPYLAAAILGGAVHHEERVARGEAGPETVERFKQALLGPFAAVGDSFFWLSLRPFAGALAALLAPWIGLWSIAVFLLVFDLPHLWLRVGLFVRGYRGGDQVVDAVAKAGLPAKGARLRIATAALGGVAVAVAALLGAGAAGGTIGEEAGLVAAALAAAGGWAGAYVVLGFRGPLVAAWAAIGLGIGLAFLGVGRG